SIAAPMKTRSPAVMVAPPRLIEPYSDDFGKSASRGTLPSGTSHFSEPSFRSTAESAPQGGGLQGTPLGESSGSRYIAYGVPFCRPNSPFKRLSRFVIIV